MPPHVAHHSTLRKHILKYVRSDKVADLLHDAGGTAQVLRCLKLHRDDRTVLLLLLPLLLLISRTGACALCARCVLCTRARR